MMPASGVRLGDGLLLIGLLLWDVAPWWGPVLFLAGWAVNEWEEAR